MITRIVFTEDGFPLCPLDLTVEQIGLFRQTGLLRVSLMHERPMTSGYAKSAEALTVPVLMLVGISHDGERQKSDRIFVHPNQEHLVFRLRQHQITQRRRQVAPTTRPDVACQGGRDEPKAD